MNYNMFNNIVEINGKVSKPQFRKSLTRVNSIFITTERVTIEGMFTFS